MNNDVLFLKTAVCFNKLTLSGLCQFYLVSQTKTERFQNKQKTLQVIAKPKTNLNIALHWTYSVLLLTNK